MSGNKEDTKKGSDSGSQLNDLLSCPFCKSSDVSLNEDEGAVGYMLPNSYAECGTCDTNGPFAEAETLEEAVKESIKKWNDAKR